MYGETQGEREGGKVRQNDRYRYQDQDYALISCSIGHFGGLSFTILIMAACNAVTFMFNVIPVRTFDSFAFPLL